MSRSPSRTLKLTYLGDASQLSQTTRGAGKDVESLGERAKNVGKKMAVAFAAIGAAAIAVGRNLFQAFEEVSTANARIEQVVTSMGNFEGAIGDVTERLVKQAEATARLTGVDRNLIKESQALLLTFDSVNKTADQAGGIFDRATDAAIDLAAAGFGSATSNAQSLGRALEDPIRGLTSLTRQGVTFTAEQQELIKSLVESNRTLEAQELILEAIERQVGGTAEATANGSAQMAQALGILRERIALALAPAFERLTELGLEFIDRVARWWDTNGPDVIRRFNELRDSVRDAFNRFKDFAGELRTELAARGVFERLKESAGGVRDAFNNMRTAFSNFLDGVSGSESQSRAGLFARIIDIGYVKPIEILLDRVEKGLKALEKLFELAERARKAIERVDRESIVPSLPNFGLSAEGFGLPASPSAAPRTGGTTINVSGAIDPEGTARTVARVINDAAQRGTTTRVAPVSGVAVFS